MVAGRLLAFRSGWKPVTVSIIGDVVSLSLFLLSSSCSNLVVDPSAQVGRVGGPPQMGRVGGSPQVGRVGGSPRWVAWEGLLKWVAWVGRLKWVAWGSPRWVAWEGILKWVACGLANKKYQPCHRGLLLLAAGDGGGIGGGRKGGQRWNVLGRVVGRDRERRREEGPMGHGRRQEGGSGGEQQDWS